MVAHSDEQGGFTLMEVLVALVIATMCIAVFFQVFSASMKLEVRVRERMLESFMARQAFSRLQQLDIQSPDFPWEGEEGGFRWRVHVAAVEVRREQVTEGPELNLPTELYRVEMVLSSDHGLESRMARYLALAPGALSEDFKLRHVSRESGE